MPSVLSKNAPGGGVFRAMALAPSRFRLPMDDADGVTGASNGATGTQAQTVGSTLAFRTSTAMGVKVGTRFHLFVPSSLDIVVGTATTTYTVTISGTDYLGEKVSERFSKTSALAYANTYTVWSVIDGITIEASSAPSDTITVGWHYGVTATPNAETKRRLPIGARLDSSIYILGGLVTSVGGGTSGTDFQAGDVIVIQGNVDDSANEDLTTGMAAGNLNNAFGLTPRKLAVMGVMSVDFAGWSVAPASCPEYLVRISLLAPSESF